VLVAAWAGPAMLPPMVPVRARPARVATRVALRVRRVRPARSVGAGA
jgi:hypothetical protein